MMESPAEQHRWAPPCSSEEGVKGQDRLKMSHHEGPKTDVDSSVRSGFTPHTSDRIDLTFYQIHTSADGGLLLENTNVF